MKTTSILSTAALLGIAAAHVPVTNFIKKMADSRSSVLGNMR